MANKDVTWQPKWVPLSILDFARMVHSFGEDSESLAKWTRLLADDLLFCNFNSENELICDMLETAKEKYLKRAKAGRTGGRPPKSKSSNLPHHNDTVSTDGPDNRPDQGRDNTANASPSCGPKEGNFKVRQSQNEDGDADFREKSDEHARSATGQLATTCGVILESGTSPSSTNINDKVAEAQASTDEVRQGQTGAGANPSVREKCCHDAPAPHGTRRGKPRPPKNAAEVVAWAADHGIDEVDARDWYELNFVIRPGCDKDGCVIENWPGHCISYCRAVKEKRESA